MCASFSDFSQYTQQRVGYSFFPSIMCRCCCPNLNRHRRLSIAMFSLLGMVTLTGLVFVVAVQTLLGFELGLSFITLLLAAMVILVSASIEQLLVRELNFKERDELDLEIKQEEEEDEDSPMIRTYMRVRLLFRIA